jgi:hypothetical protein
MDALRGELDIYEEAKKGIPKEKESAEDFSSLFNTFAIRVDEHLDILGLKLPRRISNPKAVIHADKNKECFGGRRELASNSITSLFKPEDIGRKKTEARDHTRMDFDVLRKLTRAYDDINYIENELKDDLSVLDKEQVGAWRRQTEESTENVFLNIQIIANKDVELRPLLETLVPSKEAMKAMVEDKVEEYSRLTGITAGRDRLFFLRTILDEAILVSSLPTYPPDAKHRLMQHQEQYAGVGGLSEFTVAIEDSPLMTRAREMQFKRDNPPTTPSPEIVDEWTATVGQPIEVIFDGNKLGDAYRLEKRMEEIIPPEKLTHGIRNFFRNVYRQEGYNDHMNANMRVVVEDQVVVSGREMKQIFIVNPKKHSVAAPEEDKGKIKDYFDIPTLVIKDLPRFLTKLVEFEEATRESQNVWARHQTTVSVWKNANWYDLSHPEEYLDGVIYQLKSSPMIGSRLGGSNILQTGKEIYIADFTEHRTYESGNEIRVGLIENEEWDPANVLPVVRYGRTSKDAVTIYAIQMPSEVDEDRQYVENFMNKARERATFISKMILETYKSRRDIYDQVVGGTLQDDLLRMAEDDPVKFLQEYYYELKEEGRLSEAKQRGRGREMVIRSLAVFSSRRKELANFEKVINEGLSGFMNVEKQINERAHAEDFYKRRSDNLRLFTKHLRYKDKSGNPDVELENRETMSSVSPAALVSTAMALEMFARNGISHVRLQLSYPLRPHSHELEQRVHDQFVNIFFRLMKEVSGITIDERYAEMDNAGYLHLRLQPLASNNRLLSEMIGKVDELMEQQRNKNAPDVSVQGN